jgi:hypothetical protein
MNTSEIKFRGKRIDNGEWVYGNYVEKIKPTEPTPVFWASFIHDKALTMYEVDRNTVGQFIGKLKTGDEVYINDLIQHGETIRIVEYRNGNTCLIRQNKQDTILLSFSENPKKVGNIFDNPELLHDAS